MEASLKNKRYKKIIVSSPTNTTIQRCYACKNVCNSSQPSAEARFFCRWCKSECVSVVTSRTTPYLCSTCHNVSIPTLGQEKSREVCGICSQVKKIGTKFFKHGYPDNRNKIGTLLSREAPSSMALSSSSSSFPGRHSKRAVLCGVSYTKMKFKLKGTVNDANNMRELLIKNFKFPNECIRVLTEQEKNADLIPTKHNIMESLRWLVKDCQAGDSLVFYFSGHGLQQPDFKEDEIDGFDEALCPVDFIKEGMIIDNDINSTIVWPLKSGVTLHAIVDACHSGTILDLLYVYNLERNIWEDNKPPSKEPIRKHTSGGVAICLSACEDSQSANDSTVFGGKGMNGVLTYLLANAIREQPQITYGALLDKLQIEIKKINRSRCRSSILQRIFHRKIVQDPLLSSSEKFDVSTKIFAL